MNILESPIAILLILLVIIHFCMPNKVENFDNSKKLQITTALIQGGVTLRQALKMGISKQDYITATILVANAH